jgi:hypothetical protein
MAESSVSVTRVQVKEEAGMNWPECKMCGKRKEPPYGEFYQARLSNFDVVTVKWRYDGHICKDCHELMRNAIRYGFIQEKYGITT